MAILHIKNTYRSTQHVFTFIRWVRYVCLLLCSTLSNCIVMQVYSVVALCGLFIRSFAYPRSNYQSFIIMFIQVALVIRGLFIWVDKNIPNLSISHILPLYWTFYMQIQYSRSFLRIYRKLRGAPVPILDCY